MVLGIVVVHQTTIHASGGVITNLKQTGAEANNVTITWDSVTNQHEYQYYRISNSANFTEYRDGPVSQNKTTIVGLANARIYYVQIGISTIYNNQEAPASTKWSQTLKVATAPKSVDASTLIQTGATTSSVTIKWGSVPRASSYTVYYSVVGTPLNTKQKVTVSGTTATIRKLKEETKYYMRICANLTSGSYLASSELKMAGPNILTKPGKVKGLKIEDVSESYETGCISVTVNKKENVTGYGYEVYDAKNKLVAKGSAPDHEFDITKNTLLKNQFYKIKIRAYTYIRKNLILYGPWSQPIYTSRMNGLDVSIKATASKKMKLSWGKVAGATSYTIYYSSDLGNTYKKIATTKNTSITLNKKFQKNKSFAFQIISNKKVKGKTYHAARRRSPSIYGSYSPRGRVHATPIMQQL